MLTVEAAGISCAMLGAQDALLSAAVPPGRLHPRATTSFTEQLSVPECLTLTAGLSFIQWKINENCTNLVKHDALRHSPSLLPPPPACSSLLLKLAHKLGEDTRRH